MVKTCLPIQETLQDMGSISGLGRSPEGGHGYPLQYSCLENSMDIGAWQATVHSVAESDMTEATWHACTHTGGSEVGKAKQRRSLQGQKENVQSDRCVHCLGCGDGFMGAYVCQN